MSTDTPTPRTDAVAFVNAFRACETSEDHPDIPQDVDANFARSLERKLTAANARHDALLKRLNEIGWLAADWRVTAQSMSKNSPVRVTLLGCARKVQDIIDESRTP